MPNHYTLPLRIVMSSTPTPREQYDLRFKMSKNREVKPMIYPGLSKYRIWGVQARVCENKDFPHVYTWGWFETFQPGLTFEQAEQRSIDWTQKRPDGVELSELLLDQKGRELRQLLGILDEAAKVLGVKDDVEMSNVFRAALMPKRWWAEGEGPLPPRTRFDRV